MAVKLSSLHAVISTCTITRVVYDNMKVFSPCMRAENAHCVCNHLWPAAVVSHHGYTGWHGYGYSSLHLAAGMTVSGCGVLSAIKRAQLEAL